MNRLAVLFAILLMTGCATPNKGRVALLDIDLRTPEQLSAYAVEAGIPYKDPAPVLDQHTMSLPLTIWQSVLAMCTAIDGRIRIGSVEWNVSK